MRDFPTWYTGLATSITFIIMIGTLLSSTLILKDLVDSIFISMIGGIIVMLLTFFFMASATERFGKWLFK
jgi:hypothetical protein